MHTQIYGVKGMHCASCAAIIEQTFKKVVGVHSAEVNYGTEKAKITFDSTKTDPHHLSGAIEKLGYSLDIEIDQSKKEKLSEILDMKTKVISVIPLAAFSIFVMTWDILVQFRVVPEMSDTLYEFFHHLLPILATYTLFVVGKPYLLGLYRFIRHGRANMDTLIGLGTIVAFTYSFIVTAFEETLAPFIAVEQTYYDVTIVLIAFITLGKYLDRKSVV